VAPTAEAFAAAADTELATAQPSAHNAFKITLAKRTIVSSLLELTDEGKRR
jgi:xanthine dehydrogenase YagS FAD-binding subunit